METTTNKLRSLLGADASWMQFMDEIRQSMPFLLEQGRPTSEQIQNSPIGEAGYTSWKDYVESELNWNQHSWRAWQKAYKHVLQHPWLREVEATASQINTRFNKENAPDSVDEWQLKPSQKPSEASLLSDELNHVKQENARLRGENDALKASIGQINELREELAGMLADIDRREDERLQRVRRFNELPWYLRLVRAI